jgi:hypothetical protein
MSWQRLQLAAVAAAYSQASSSGWRTVCADRSRPQRLRATSSDGQTKRTGASSGCRGLVKRPNLHLSETTRPAGRSASFAAFAIASSSRAGSRAKGSVPQGWALGLDDPRSGLVARTKQVVVRRPGHPEHPPRDRQGCHRSRQHAGLCALWHQCKSTTCARVFLPRTTSAWTTRDSPSKFWPATLVERKANLPHRLRSVSPDSGL